MRPSILFLAWLSGLGCQEYFIAATTPGTVVHPEVAPPQASVPLTRVETPTPGIRRRPRTTPPAVPRSPVPAAPACIEAAALIDTSEPESPYAPAVLADGPCPTAGRVTWRSGELRADAADVHGDVGWLDVSVPGTYHLYAPPLAAADADATGLLRVVTVDRPGGRPLHGNCGVDWVVRPGPTDPGDRVYLGTFALEAGPNAVRLLHGCTLPAGGGCGVGVASTEVCTTPGSTPVALRGADLCLVPAD